MKKYKNHTLEQYLKVLSLKEPVPGGGSAAALSAAMGASLICMVARYSIGKSESKKIDRQINKVLTKAEVLKERFLELVDLDAQAYLAVVKARKLSKKEQNAAARKASKVPLTICRECYKAMELLPVLVTDGNRHLVSDVEVAAELLFSGFNGALVLYKCNG